MSIIDLLDQEEIWVDGQGVEHQITDMEPRYCANVVRFLLRQAEAIALAEDMAFLSVPMPDVDTVAFDSVMFDPDDPHKTKNPQAWLMDHPLLHALSARAEADS
jgi:hypothetical protein